MNRLSELSKYRNTIISRIISDDELIKAIGNNEVNFLDIAKKDPITLLYNNIYPYYHVPTIQDEEKTYLSFTVSNIKKANNMYKFGNIDFYIYCHNSLFKTDYDVIRTDFISNRLDEIFNQSRDFGIGKLQFEQMMDVRITNYHNGVCMKYSNCDFN